MPQNTAQISLKQNLIGKAGECMSDKPGNDDIERKIAGLEQQLSRLKNTEAELKISAEKYKHIFDHSPAAVYLSDQNGKILSVNKAWERLFGFPSRESIIGLNSNHVLFTDPEERERYKRILEQRGFVEGFETQMRRYDGSIIDVEITGSAKRKNAGEIECFEGFITDISARKKAERDLRISEEKYRTVAENSLAGIYMFQDGGTFSYVNQRFAEMLGYDCPEEIMGRHFWELVHPDDRNMVKGKGLNREKTHVEPTHYSFRCIRKDGTTIWVSMRAVHASYRGKPAATGNIIDITERKLAEKKLLDSEEKYRTVVENSLTGIFIHQKGKYRYINHRLAEMLGYDRPEEIIDKPFWEIVHPDDQAMVRTRGLRRQAGDFYPNHYIFRVLKSDGSIMWVEMRASSSTYQGSSAVIGNVVDITERKRAEEEIRLLSRRLIDVIEEERRLLAADLHDEFGQGLTALHMDLDALKASMPEDFQEQRDKCQVLLNRVERMADGIRATISHLRPSILDHLGLIPTMESTISEFSQRKPEIYINFQAVGLKKRLASQTEIVLYRILQECLINISKHSEARHVDIMLTASHPWVILIIKDDGMGFKQGITGLPVAGSTKGIGFLSMRERIAPLGGSIDISSSPGRGTAVRIKLPITSGDGNESDTDTISG